MNNLVLKSKERVGRLNDIWLWLAGFRYYIEELKKQGKIIDFGATEIGEQKKFTKKKLNLKDQAILLASKSKLINSTAKHIRNKYRDKDLRLKKKEMLKKYPSEQYKT